MAVIFWHVPACRAQQTSPPVSSWYNNAEFARSLAEYKKQADAKSIDAYLDLGVAFKDLALPGIGIRLLKKARAVFGDDARLLALLGRLYYLNDQVDRAIEVLEKELSAQPGDNDARITLGLCYERKGDDAKAQEYFQQVIAADQNNIIAHVSLADLYYRHRKLSEGAQEYKAINTLDASIQHIYKYWADILYILGNLEEAFKVYQKAAQIAPQDTFVQARLDAIRTQLGKEYFEKERLRIQARRLAAAVFVKPGPSVKSMSFVRVGLIQGASAVELKSSTEFSIRTKKDQVVVTKGNAREKYRVATTAEGKMIITDRKGENLVIDEAVLFKPVRPEGTVTLFDVQFGKNDFWQNQEDRSYRGQLELASDGKTIFVVNIVSLEEYLYGVIPAEMPGNWPLEALKAQAVAARSETLAKMGRHRAQGFDLCAEVHCQVYGGVERETQASNQAVDQTRGMILEYKGKPVDAIYSSSCGGHTQGNIFGKDSDVPYFKGTPDSADAAALRFPLSPAALESWLKEPPTGIYCDIPEYSKTSNFRWIRIYTPDELNRLIQSVKDIGEVEKLIVLKRNPSGHVDKLKVVGTKGTCILEKELAIRKTLGNLRSSMFKVEVKLSRIGLPEQFVFYGGGWGHGVGMCQAGACGMAQAGKDYRAILEHYFSATKFKKLY